MRSQRRSLSQCCAIEERFIECSHLPCRFQSASCALVCLVATEKVFPVTENGHSLTRNLFVATWAASLVATSARQWTLGEQSQHVTPLLLLCQAAASQPRHPEGEPREREGSGGRKLPPSQILQVAKAPIRMTIAGQRRTAPAGSACQSQMCQLRPHGSIAGPSSTVARPSGSIAGPSSTVERGICQGKKRAARTRYKRRITGSCSGRSSRAASMAVRDLPALVSRSRVRKSWGGEMRHRRRGEDQPQRKGDPDKRLVFVLFRYFKYWDQGELSQAAVISQSEPPRGGGLTAAASPFFRRCPSQRLCNT